jgi:glutamate synthase (NADPH/NADH) small chain
MGKVTGFLEYERTAPEKQDPRSRIEHYNEFVQQRESENLNHEG